MGFAFRGILPDVGLAVITGRIVKGTALTVDTTAIEGMQKGMGLTGMPTVLMRSRPGSDCGKVIPIPASKLAAD